MSIQIKTAAVTGPKTCEILELTTPDLGRGEVLVKVHAVALCTLEQRIFRGEVKMPLPCTGGHEVAGEIADLGPGVNTKLWAKGQRVAVRLLYNCGECYYCRTGRTNMCERAQKKPVREGLLPGPGGLCDYIIVDAASLLKIPDTLSYEEACILYAAYTADQEDNYGPIVGGIDSYTVSAMDMILFIYQEKEKGYVTLRPMERDKRSKALCLTAAGRAYADAVLSELQEMELYAAKRMGLARMRRMNEICEEFLALFKEAGGQQKHEANV